MNFVNLKTYNNMKKACAYSTMGLCIVGMNISYPELTQMVGMTTLGTFSTYIALSSTKLELYTREGNQIYKLYKEFIKNYHVLNKAFQLEHPIEIFTMYEYLLNHGYLSYNKQVYNNQDYIDLRSLYGSKVLTGANLCRHNVALLNDIFKDNGISAYRLVGSTRFIGDRKNFSIIGKHIITYVSQNGIDFFLDPTQSKIYRMRNNNGNILSDSKKEFLIKKGYTVFVFPSQATILTKLKDKSNFISNEEEIKRITKTKSILERNKDLLERFYMENNGIYNEITNQYAKVKKR